MTMVQTDAINLGDQVGSTRDLIKEDHSLAQTSNEADMIITKAGEKYNSDNAKFLSDPKHDLAYMKKKGNYVYRRRPRGAARYNYSEMVRFVRDFEGLLEALFVGGAT